MKSAIAFLLMGLTTMSAFAGEQENQFQISNIEGIYAGHTKEGIATDILVIERLTDGSYRASSECQLGLTASGTVSSVIVCDDRKPNILHFDNAKNLFVAERGFGFATFNISPRDSSQLEANDLIGATVVHRRFSSNAKIVYIEK